MKYEISQAQYRDFLNTISSSHQDTRFPNQYGNDRHYIREGSGENPYGCDADGDGVFNEANDGEWIACNYLSWDDLCAYLDWAALRPMTELEYEKACRGPNITDNEYAWGSSEYTEVQTLTNGGTANEGVTESGNGLVNCYETSTGPDGPLRCGFAAKSNTNRREAGASYWGIMELTGNVWEFCIGVYSADDPPVFDGTHGDGELGSDGNDDISSWPAQSDNKVGLRGGSWSNFLNTPHASTCHSHFGQVASRHAMVWTSTARNASIGGRGVRTAP
jgi:formylglycine-generating enzyme required for sulfatase activity